MKPNNILILDRIILPKYNLLKCECLICHSIFATYDGCEDSLIMCCSNYTKKLKLNLVGMVFSKLTVLYNIIDCNKSESKFLCKCQCGKFSVVYGKNLRKGFTTTCGCLLRDNKLTHGMTNTHIYNCWRSMIRRCYEESNNAYKWYGARGIEVCEDWKSFDKFYYQFGITWPGTGYSIDRIDNDGNYEPNNCKWSTRTEQNRNRINTIDLNTATLIREDYSKNNISMAKLAEKYSCKTATVWQIIHNMIWN
jgi:hypothetical protein